MAAKLADLICDFCRNTVGGQESGLYKVTAPRGDLQMLKNPVMHLAMRQSIIHYLNICYRALVLENDPYVVKKFDEMKAALNHSSVCLLNFIAALVMKCYSNMDRSKLDVSSYDAYMTSVFEGLDRILDASKKGLTEGLGHQCEGEDISKCDPNKQMFY